MGLFTRLKSAASKLKNYGKQTYDWYLGAAGPQKSKKQLRQEQSNIKKAARTAKMAGRRSFSTEKSLKQVARAVNKSGNPKVEALNKKVADFAATKRGDQIRRIAQGYAAGAKGKGQLYSGVRQTVNAAQRIQDDNRRAESKNKITKIKRSTGSISRSAQNMFYAATKSIWNRPGVTDNDAAIMEAFGVNTIDAAMEIVFHDVAQRSGRTTDDLMQPFAEVEYLEEIIQELNAFYMRLTS